MVSAKRSENVFPPRPLYYRLHDLLLSSQVPLPALPSGSIPPHAGGPVWTFRSAETRHPQPLCTSWYHHWGPEDEPWLSLAKLDGEYLLRFHSLADFRLSLERREIIAEPVGETPLDTIAHLLLNQVAALIAGDVDRLVVHASAVQMGDVAIAFVGETGRGKSTLAAHFGVRGFPLVTDDCLVLDHRGNRLIATPSYPSLRLWSDSAEHLIEDETRLGRVAHYTTKKRVDLSPDPKTFAAGPLPLRRMYFLASSDDGAAGVGFSPIHPREVLLELVSSCLKLDITDREVLRREFELLADIAAQPLFFRLSFPHDYARLPEVQQAILAHAAQP